MSSSVTSIAALQKRVEQMLPKAEAQVLGWHPMITGQRGLEFSGRGRRDLQLDGAAGEERWSWMEWKRGVEQNRGANGRNSLLCRYALMNIPAMPE